MNFLARIGLTINDSLLEFPIYEVTFRSFVEWGESRSGWQHFTSELSIRADCYSIFILNV